MSERSEREFLLGVFLVEAWDTAGALEEGIGRLAAAGDDRAVASLLVLAHRLKGSAALHGFRGLSDLAAGAEEQLERASRADPPERERIRRRLAEVVALVKASLDRIGAVGGEDAGRIAALRARHVSGAGSVADETIELRAPAVPAFAGRAAPGRDASGADADAIGSGADVGDGVFRALDRFFAEGGDAPDYFGQEASEHLEVMTASLLGLERAGRRDEELAALFRAAHTLKGAAYTVGCGPVGDLAHRMEDLLVEIRERRAPLGPLVVEAILAGVDALRLMLQGPGTPRARLAGALAHARAGLATAMAASRSGVPDSPAELPVEPPALDLVGAADQAEGEAPELIEPAVAAAAIAPPAAPRPAPLRLAPAGRDGEIHVGASIRVRLDRLDSLMNLVGELMIARSRLDRGLGQLDRVTEVLHTTRIRMDRAVRDFERARPASLSPARREADEGATGSMPGGASVAEMFAELEFDRYDDTSMVVRSVGELSADVGLAESQHAALLRAIREDVAHVQRLTAALRKEVTRARMVPIGRMFSRFARQVREVAGAAGKRVALETHGESVEVDNSVVEHLGDSLLHVVQNAIVHGIEPESERRERGKPPQGTVSLRAFQQGGFVFVEVEDDGAGMDADRLRRQAVAQGLLAPEAARALSAAEAINLIFLPGFSTAATVTKAAGRGVGLDVVRTNVSRLNGEIEVQTEAGARTRFTFKLPLTLAIADALIVRAGGEVLAIPLTTVGVMRFVEAAAIQSLGDREMVELDSRVMELIRMDRVLGLGGPGRAPARLPVVELRAGGLPFAVAVDELLGKEEIVIKGLGDFLEGVGPFAGATISGEGRVILLVDPTQLFEMSRDACDWPGAAVAAEEGDGAASVQRDRPAVLLVDDSISVRRFVGQMLERGGFRVFTAVDGQDALEQLTEQPVDVVITDLEMPRVNGYALVEDMRRRPATRRVPVVVLTTRAGDKHMSLARRLGVRHYVAKPVEEEFFVALIRSVASAAAAEACPAAAGTTWS